MTTLHCLARPIKPTRERLRGVQPQACVERDDGSRRDLLAPSIKEARLPEHPEHTQTSRETCGDCAGRGAVAWAGGEGEKGRRGLEGRGGRARVVVAQTLLYDMCVSPYTPMSTQLIRVAEHLGVETPGVPATPSPP